MPLLKMIVNIEFISTPEAAESRAFGPSGTRPVAHQAMHSGAAALSALALFALACQRERPSPAPTPSTPTPPAANSAAPTATSVEREEAIDAGGLADATPAEAPELADVGPAGPASATPRGVVLITRDDQLLLAALSKDPKSLLEAIELDGGAFAQYARGPAITGDFAYWISKGRLVGKRLSGGGLEVLAEDARDGTRVAAASVGESAVVAYVARPSTPGGDATARLWVSGGETLRLSPEGAAASSVALVETAHGALALTLEGRTGMTPLHARRLGERGGKVVLEDDVVAWVGGSAQSLTEVVGGVSPNGGVWGFVAIERDVTGFGLAEIDLGERPKMGAPVTWRMYPNGLDPAPVATGRACGESWLAHARPAESKPGAPQELHLSALGANGLGPSRVLSRSRAFVNVSVAAAGDAILVAYTADHRTWGVRVRCAPKKK